MKNSKSAPRGLIAVEDPTSLVLATRRYHFVSGSNHPAPSEDTLPQPCFPYLCSVWWARGAERVFDIEKNNDIFCLNQNIGMFVAVHAYY